MSVYAGAPYAGYGLEFSTVDVPPSDDSLSGTSGSFTVDFAATANQVITYTPDADGYLVIQDDDGTRVPIYTITDADGDQVQVSVARLGLVWSADQPMTITIRLAPGPTPAPVDFTWSYAPRASSVLVIDTRYDYVEETPSGLELTISNGAAGEVVTFSMLGETDVPDFESVTLDEFGKTNVVLNLPAMDAGNYLLHAEGTASGAEDTPLTIQTDALAYGDDIKPVDTPPTVVPITRWRFIDQWDHSVTHTFPHNPESWSNVFPPTDFTHGKTTAPDGQPLTWQAATRPWRMEFSGTTWDQEEYDQLVFWSNLRRRFWLIDHRNRAWLITIEQFDAQAQVKPGYPWLHKYTVRTLVFMQGTTG